MDRQLHDLYHDVYVSDEMDCVRHCIREIASAFDLPTREVIRMVAHMYGLDSAVEDAELERVAGELGIQWPLAPASLRV